MAAAESRRALTRIVLIGTTASGKSEVALGLARKFGGEIIGADSRQIYRGLEVGTAAPSPEERLLAPHHFASFLDPTEAYSAGRYGREARAAVLDCEARGRLAVVVGGSGLYIRALLEGLFEGPSRDDALRARLAERLRAEGLTSLREELGRVDPEALVSILPGDAVRVIRALEVHELTGRRISDLRRQRAREPFSARVFGLRWPRAILAGRIAARLSRQLASGFLDEANRLLTARLPDDAPGPRTLGYRELIAHLRGETTLEEAAAAIIRKTRQLAKRQETWFKRTAGVTWFSLEKEDDLARVAEAIGSEITRGGGQITC
ncbi:MAG TPA: tRNA (adenosine(37)-N6)-dimethylallyltransferase MiaA [Thermoplasmata archaeon]|nr:tRNA (adenosine(37)-N6)-dimethylallyltransferase MiaA [Thermoplasmata archaeon]